MSETTTKGRLFNLLLSLVLVVGLMPGFSLTAFANDSTLMAASWDNGVPYLDENGAEQAYDGSYTTVSNQTTWNSGWYVADGNTTIGGRITVNGDVKLILADNASLTASSGITVEGSNKLTVYAQSTSNDMGALSAAAVGNDDDFIYPAAIGGYEHAGGTVIINGGSVTATGSVSDYGGGAGIGAGMAPDENNFVVGWRGCDVTINGGKVTANGGMASPGIGDGPMYAMQETAVHPFSSVTINGGIVTANGNSVEGGGGGAGIGGGYGGHGVNVTINGGTVTATGGNGSAGIGDGNGYPGNFAATIVVTDGQITASGGNGYSGDDTYGPGAGIGGGGGTNGKPTNRGALDFSDNITIYAGSTPNPTTTYAFDGDFTGWYYFKAKHDYQYVKLVSEGGSTVDVSSISLDKTDEQAITAGESVSFTATIEPYDATDQTVKWSSSDDSKVKLYSDSACETEIGTGATSTMTVYAKGISAGSATVTVTSNADDTKSASCAVTVTAAKYTVTLSGGANTDVSGNTTQADLTGAMETVTYTAQSGYHFEDFSDITQNGITATKTSDTVVTVSGTPTGNVEITVPDAVLIPVAVTNITLDKTSAQEVNVGSNVSFTATIEPSGATDKTVKWSVGGTDTGAVKLYSDAECTTLVGTGATDTLTVYAKGISEGSATISVTSNDDETKTASCDVTVTDPLNSVSYLYWNGSSMVSGTCDDYTVVTSDTTYLEDGKWYVVKGEVTIDSRIRAGEGAYLILADNATLNANAGITVQGINSLTIYSQSFGDDMGSLVATAVPSGSTSSYPAYFPAGIGGYNGDAGTLVIDGGNITAKGNQDGSPTTNGGAGIGGAWGLPSYNNYKGYSCGSVTINGGTVTAYGANCSPGIGNGFEALDITGGSVTINGGTVVASGGSRGAGIGSGDYSRGADVTINGGTVTATSSAVGAGIGNGGGSNYDPVITINGGSITANGGNAGAGSYQRGAGIGSGGKSYGTNPNRGTIVIGSNVTVYAGSQQNPTTDVTSTFAATHTQQYVTTVATAAVTGVTLSPSEAQTISVGESVAFTATVTPSDASDLSVIWSVGGTDTSAVKLYSDAECTQEVGDSATDTLTVYAKGISVGSANVTVTSNADSSKTASCDVDVTAPPVVDVTNVSLSPSAAQTISVGGSVSFTATITPSNATDKTVKWSVGGSDTSAVKLYTDAECTQEVGDGATETLTVYAQGESAGTANVTVTSNADASKSAYCAVTVEPLTPITYLTWNGSQMVEATCDNYIEVTSETTTFADGKWYVVCNDVNISGGITVNGTAHLILCDGKTLTTDGGQRNAGINVSNDNALTIYAQSEGDGMGSLTATGGWYSAGIGGKYVHDAANNTGGTETVGGTITINGGNITATGCTARTGGVQQTGGAGIGGAYCAEGGTITINGGVVNATGGYGDYCGSAGIGTGYWGGGTSGTGNTGSTSVTINGGTVTATGSKSGAGIGGGYSNKGGTTTINGGAVTATGSSGGAGIGGGGGAVNPGGAGGTITINGGSVNATGVDGGAGIGGGVRADGGTIEINGGDVTTVGGEKLDWSTSPATVVGQAPGIGGGYNGTDGTLSLDAGVKMIVSSDNSSWSVYDGSTRAAYMKTGEVPHTHNFTYAADGATITATCTAEGCPLDDGTEQHAHTATLTLVAPTMTTYGQSGEGISAEVTVTDENSIQGDAAVHYFAANAAGTDKTGEELSGAPTDAGSYWAEITLSNGNGSATAHVTYTIAKAQEEAPADAAAALGQLSVDYPNETIAAKTGYEVSASGEGEGTEITNFSSILDNATPTVYVRKSATDANHIASDWVATTLTARPDAPSGLVAVDASDPTSADGSISGVDDTMEYSADGTAWTAVTSTSITGLNPGTYSVRVKATESAPHGTSVDMTVSDRLDDIKTTAKNDLDTLLAGKTEADYYADDWTTLTNAISSGKANIDNATTAADVATAKNAAVDAVNAVKTKAQKDAEALAAAKTEAKADLDTLLSSKTESDYDAEDWTTLTQAIADGKTAIDNATTLDGVASAKSDAIDAVNAVQTKDQKEAAALAAAKTAAKADLDTLLSSKNESDYYADDWTTLTQAISDGKDAIDDATTINGVTTAKTNAVDAVNAVQTKAQRDAAALAAAQTEAKADLDTLLGSKSEADYDAEDWATLTQAITDGKTAIDNATTLDGVAEAKSDAIDAVNAVKTKAQKEAEALAAAKTTAKGELDTLLQSKSEDDYYADDWTDLTQAIDNGKDAIDGATTIDGVTTAKNNAVNAVNAVQTKAQRDAAALADAQTAAKADLDTLLSSKTEADYDAEDWTTLTQAISDGKTAIDNATTLDGVSEAKSDAIDAVNAVKTKAQKEAEALEAAKTTAKGELDTLLSSKSESDYYADDWAALNQAINNGKDAIDDATTIDGVATAKNNAVDAANAVQTKAQRDAAALATAKETAKENLDTLLSSKNEADYDADDWTALNQAITDGKAAIDDATTLDGVTTAKSNAISAVNAIKTKAQKEQEALDAAKTAAKGELDTLLESKNESDYYPADWTALNQAIADGKSAIDDATTTDAVTAAKDDAVNASGAIKTKAQKDAEALAEAKATAKDALDALLRSKNEADYDPADWTALNQAITNGKNAIDEATTVVGVTTAKDDAVNAVNAIKTKAQKEADRAAADAVIGKINALPEASEVTAEDADKITEARDAYEALTPDQKAYVDADTLKKLTNDEDALAIAKAMSEVSAKELSYTGNPQQLVNAPTTQLPTGCSMKYALTTENTPPADAAYAAAVPSATDAGDYYVWYKVSGAGDGQVQSVKASIDQVSIAQAEVTLDKTSYTYDGKEKTPSVKSVVLGDKTLEEGTDYEVSYKDNIEVGTAKAVITGKGNYAGTCEAAFQIAEREVAYTLVSGPGGAVKQGAGETAEFEFKRSFDDETTLEHFDSVKVDGKTVPETAYSTRKGSVIIALKSDYIDTLDAGDHDLVAVFDDGQGTATLSIAAPDAPASEGDSDSASGSSNSTGKTSSTSSSPKMGDSIGWVIGLAALTALLSGAAVVIIARKREER